MQRGRRLGVDEQCRGIDVDAQAEQHLEIEDEGRRVPRGTGSRPFRNADRVGAGRAFALRAPQPRVDARLRGRGDPQHRLFLEQVVGDGDAEVGVGAAESRLGQRHQSAHQLGITRVAVGRDFGDVTPLRGVIRGGGRHTLTVGVSTRRLWGAGEVGEREHELLE